MRRLSFALALLLAPFGGTAAEPGSAEGYGLSDCTLADRLGGYSFFPQSDLYPGRPLPKGGSR